MSRTVFCVRNKENLKGLDRQPMPGALGIRVFNELSVTAWQEWTQVQTMLINENRLNLMNKGDRETLYKELERFLNGEDVAKPKEYVSEPDA